MACSQIALSQAVCTSRNHQRRIQQFREHLSKVHMHGTNINYIRPDSAMVKAQSMDLLSGSAEERLTRLTRHGIAGFILLSRFVERFIWRLSRGQFIHAEPLWVMYSVGHSIFEETDLMRKYVRVPYFHHLLAHAWPAPLSVERWGRPW